MEAGSIVKEGDTLVRRAAHAALFAHAFQQFSQTSGGADTRTDNTPLLSARPAILPVRPPVTPPPPPPRWCWRR